jgi:hypothetical protein
MKRAKMTDSDVPANLHGAGGLDPLFDTPEPTPGVKGRRARTITITFSSAEIPRRLRRLAYARGLTKRNGSPQVSQIVEELLLPALEEAERAALPDALREAKSETWT